MDHLYTLSFTYKWDPRMRHMRRHLRAILAEDLSFSLGRSPLTHSNEEFAAEQILARGGLLLAEEVHFSGQLHEVLLSARAAAALRRLA